jgi:hypothetical protein
MSAIHEGSIVRVTGKAGDWRVLPGVGLTLGSHQPQVSLESVSESWVHKLTVPLASVYLSLLGPLLP